MTSKKLVVAAAVALTATLGATSATLAQTFYAPPYGYAPSYGYSYGDVPAYGYGGYGPYYGVGDHTGGPGGLGIGAQRG
jgi:hypothetical protein